MTPWHVLLGLQARRRKPRIIRYNHEHPGPAHDGRAQRRCPRICEHSYPSINDDFVANFANVRNPPSGGQIAELTMEAGAAGCIVNSDETHHKLSNEGERGGSRANTQTDPDLPRTGRRKVQRATHHWPARHHRNGGIGDDEQPPNAWVRAEELAVPPLPPPPFAWGAFQRWIAAQQHQLHLMFTASPLPPARAQWRPLSGAEVCRRLPLHAALTRLLRLLFLGCCPPPPQVVISVSAARVLRVGLVRLLQACGVPIPKALSDPPPPPPLLPSPGAVAASSGMRRVGTKSSESSAKGRRKKKPPKAQHIPATLVS